MFFKVICYTTFVLGKSFRSPRSRYPKHVRRYTQDILCAIVDKRAICDIPDSDDALFRIIAVEEGVHPSYDFFVKFSRNGAIKSMGTGKMMVEFFSDEISVSVWRKRSCSAIGCASMMCAASASFCEA